MDYLDRIITETLNRYLTEVRYDNDTQPHNSKTDTHIHIGRNPLTVDVGGHSSQDVLSQPSTIDWNGENMEANTEHIFVSDNKFTFYKVKNFGNPNVTSTMGFFKNDKGFRAAIDTINGAATRNNRIMVYYRTITPESRADAAKRSGYTLNTFWEFSYDRERWFIIQPNPTQNMKESSFKKPPVQESRLFLRRK